MRRVICDIIIIICLCVLVFCGLKLRDYFQDAKESKIIVSEVKEEIKDKEKPQNPYRVGWIKIPKSKVDYPVMQRDSFYLHKDYHEKDSVRGCLFVDANTDLSESRNILIYGHHMMDGSMFGELVKYSNYDYFQEHQTVYYTPKNEKKRTYKVVAMFKSQTFDEESYLDYANLADEESYEKYVKYIEKKSETSVSGIEWPTELLTLSTCSYHLKRTDPRFHDGRFCVVAVRIK